MAFVLVSSLEERKGSRFDRSSFPCQPAPQPHNWPQPPPPRAVQAAAATALQEVAAAAAQQAPLPQQAQQQQQAAPILAPLVQQAQQAPQGQEQLAIAAAHLFLSDLQQRVLSVSTFVTSSALQSQPLGRCAAHGGRVRTGVL